MTDPVPVRAIERERITRPHEVIETERVVEFATAPPTTPAPRPGRELPRGYDPERDGPLADSGLSYRRPAPAGAPALPPGSPAPVRWWRRWLS